MKTIVMHICDCDGIDGYVEKPLGYMCAKECSVSVCQGGSMRRRVGGVGCDARLVDDEAVTCVVEREWGSASRGRCVGRVRSRLVCV